MSEYIEISAKTVDDAITAALLKLETTSDKIEYEVIEKGSAGFLGFIGKTDAVIRVRKKFNLVDFTYELSTRFRSVLKNAVLSSGR